MKKSFLLILLAGLTFLWLMAGCGPKAIKEASVLDTPENHYNQGMRELDRGNLDTAAGEFQRALALNPNSSIAVFRIRSASLDSMQNFSTSAEDI